VWASGQGFDSTCCSFVVRVAKMAERPQFSLLLPSCGLRSYEVLFRPLDPRLVYSRLNLVAIGTKYETQKYYIVGCSLAGCICSEGRRVAGMR